MVVLIGILLAVVASGATYYLLSRPSSNAQPVPQRTVVVAAQTIPARTRITAEMLRTERVPDSGALQRVLEDQADAVGKLAAINIAPGDLISASMYAAGTAGGMNIIAPDETIGPDSPVWRAVSITAPADRAVGGKIEAGDHVDLFVTLNPQLFDPSGGVPQASPDTIVDPDHNGPMTLGYYSEATTKLTWTNVEVLSADAENLLYVVRVDEHQAEEIAHVQSVGAKFTLGLRPAADARDVDSNGYGRTTNMMIDLYGFPIPNMIEVPAELPSPAP
jgi:Flp pilus assembly protein CpaB